MLCWPVNQVSNQKEKLNHMTTNDISQTGLREPEITDWDNAFKGSSYTPPPPAFNADGTRKVYYGVVKGATKQAPDEGFLNYLLDPIVVTKSGSYDGYELRFTRASVRPFERNGVVMKGNPNKLGSYLRAAGLSAKPQTNADYEAAVKAAVGRPFAFVGDWEAYNKDTGESIKGYLNFPEDPERPGQRKSILKAGDLVTIRDKKGNLTGDVITVQSDVLFANFRLSFFQDPSRGVK